jgi:hypothetical protein
MRDLNYDVDRALGIPARRPAALLSAAVDEVLDQPIGAPNLEVLLMRVLHQQQELREVMRKIQETVDSVCMAGYGPLNCRVAD